MENLDEAHPDLSEENLQELLKTSSLPLTDKVPLENLSSLFKVPDNPQVIYGTYGETFERYKVKIDLFKWLIGTIGLTIITYIINWGFRDREQGMNEISQYDKYATDLIVFNDNPVNRRMLAQFFSNVTPSEKLKNGWMSYYKEVNNEYISFLIKDSIQRRELEQLKNIDSNRLTPPQKLKIVKFENAIVQNDKIKDAPIVIPNSKTTSLNSVFIQSVSLSKESSEKIKLLIQTNGFNVPGIQYMDKLKFGNLLQNEIRYYRNDDLPSVDQLQSVLNEQNIDTKIKFIPNLSSKVQLGTIELWLK